MNTEKRPRIYLEFSTRKFSFGRVLIELYNDIVPKTVKNFMALVSHEKGYGYKGSKVHRIVPGFVIQMGDFTTGDGTGGYSIYGKYFEDENFEIDHDKPGLLSMANSGPNKNGSQFFITLNPAPWLNGKHVVFGEVVKGMDTVVEIENCGNVNETPQEDIRITDLGVLKN